MNSTITTAELFRALSLCIGKEKPASAYAVAKVLGCTQSCAKNWELGHRVMDEAHAVKVAELLSLELDFVVLSLQAERAEKTGMDKIAGIFARAALAVQSHGSRVASGFAVMALSLPFLLVSLENYILCFT